MVKAKQIALVTGLAWFAWGSGHDWEEARIWAAVVETGRQEDGSVVLPKALHPYLGGTESIPAPAVG